MTDARTMRALVLALAALAFAACKSESPAEPTPTPSAPEEAEAPAAPAGLVASGEYVFGLPVPEGAVEEERGRTHVHFDIDASRDLVVAFFRNELPDFAPTEYREGVKLEASDASDRSIYVYGDGDDDVLLTYFDETPGEDPAARNSAEALRNILDERNPDRRIATDGSALVTANRSGRAQGPIGATPRQTRTDPRPRWARSDDEEFAGARERPGTSTAVAANTPSSPSGSQRDGTAGDGGSNSNGTTANGGGDTTIRRVQPVRQRPARGTTNPAGTRPIDFVHGTYEPPRNPNAYY